MAVAASPGPTMLRDVDWKQAFFVAAGVPALVLFSMGAISATIGAPAWLVWTISVLFGFVQSFIYAEIAGLHPSKSGGTAVHGATAWIRYSQFLAPLSLWSNWLAWTPVLAIGSGLGAGYLLSIFYAPDAAINTWQITLVDLGFLKDGLSLRINATFIIGAVIMLVVFAIQHRGILRTARIQTILTIGDAVAPLHRLRRAAADGRRRTRELLAVHAARQGRQRRDRARESGTRAGGCSSSVVCSSRPGRPTPSRRPSAT